MDLAQKIKKEFGKNLKFNEPLKNWTTFRIGGPARYFFMAESVEDLNKAIEIAQQFKIPYFILGEGSNLLFSDQGFSGLMIKNKISRLEIIRPRRTGLRPEIIVGAGIKLAYLVINSIKFGLTGLEWAAGIPGSVGGAVYQNAGAFGSDFSKSIQNVMILRNGKTKKLNKKECGFAYRSSIFQKNKDIILEVELKLKKGDQKKGQELIKKNINQRLAKQPRGFSAGSVFKNANFKEISQKTLNTYPQLQSFKESGIISAGWLIENAGLKGLKIGGAQISEKHANFIINTGMAKAKNVLALIKTIKKRVKQKFGLEIEEEIQQVNT